MTGGRTIYEVLPQGGGPGPTTDWAVKKRGNAHASNVYPDKRDAVARGKELAKGNPPSQLIVHTADGKFENEYTYGDDPYPPRG